MTQFVFSVPDGSIGDARRDDGEVVSVVRFGFVVDVGEVEPTALVDRRLVSQLALGVFGRSPKIVHQNVERHWAYCPLCMAPILVHVDGKTCPLSNTDEEDRSLQDIRKTGGGAVTVLPEGELWIATLDERPLIAPMLVVHYVDYHGYSPPMRVLELLAT